LRLGTSQDQGLRSSVQTNPPPGTRTSLRPYRTGKGVGRQGVVGSADYHRRYWGVENGPSLDPFDPFSFGSREGREMKSGLDVIARSTDSVVRSDSLH
jgi:hypothetical protein